MQEPRPAVKGPASLIPCTKASGKRLLAKAIKPDLTANGAPQGGRWPTSSPETQIPTEVVPSY